VRCVWPGHEDAARSWQVDGLDIVDPGVVVAEADTTIRCAYRVGDLSFAVVAEVRPRPEVSNMLVVMLDDMGIDVMARWSLGEVAATTPVIDQMMDEGVSFTRTYAQPNCSPARASLLTGRQPYRHGVGTAMPEFGSFPLPLEEQTIAELVAEAGWRSALTGKWHLATLQVDFLNHPTDSGFDHYSGSMVGFGDTLASDGLPQTYFSWEKVSDGRLFRTDTYATTDTFDDALLAIDLMPEPWLLIVSPNAPHTPFHVPPGELLSGDPATVNTSTERYLAMIEAVDTELGRLLDTMDPDVLARTTTMVLGDNGTPVRSFAVPVGEAKGSPFERGVRVPLVVTGPFVDRGGVEVEALSHIVDIFSTASDIAGVSPRQVVDGVSLVPYLRDAGREPLREFVYAERFSDNGFELPKILYRRTIRDDGYKLVQDYFEGNVTVGLYAVPGIGFEGPNLLDAPLQADAEAALDRLEGAMPFAWPY